MNQYYLPRYSDVIPKNRDFVYIPDLLPKLRSLGFSVFGVSPILIFNTESPQIRMTVNEKGVMFLEMDTDEKNLLENVVINVKNSNGRPPVIHMIINILQADTRYIVKYNRLAKLMNVPKLEVVAEA